MDWSSRSGREPAIKLRSWPSSVPESARSSGCAGLAESARRRLDELVVGEVALGELVEVILADGSLGDPARAPYRRVIVSAGAPSLPGPLVEQLDEGGRMVIPVGPIGEQQMVVVVRAGGRITETPVGRCAFVPLIGTAGYEPPGSAPPGNGPV